MELLYICFRNCKTKTVTEVIFVKTNSKLVVLTLLSMVSGFTPSISGAAANIGTWSFLKGTPAEMFTDEDWSIFESNLVSTIGSEQDGASNTWENPKTHNSGTITVLKTLKNGDQDCKLLQITNQAKDRKRVTKPLFCKQPDWGWKVTSLKKPQK